MAVVIVPASSVVLPKSELLSTVDKIENQSRLKRLKMVHLADGVYLT